MDDQFLSVAYVTPAGRFKVTYCDWIEFKGNSIVLHSHTIDHPVRTLPINSIKYINPMPMN